MAGFADEARKREQDVNEIKENVQKIYKTVELLRARVDGLQKIILSSKNPNDVDKTTMEAIKALNVAITDIDKKITTSTQNILRKIPPKRQLSLKENAVKIAINVMLTCLAIEFFMGLGDIRKEVEYIKSGINVIQWNQTTGIMPGARTYSPWEMNDFTKAWNNQNAYIQQYRQQNTQHD